MTQHFGGPNGIGATIVASVRQHYQACYRQALHLLGHLFNTAGQIRSDFPGLQIVSACDTLGIGAKTIDPQSKILIQLIQ